METLIPALVSGAITLFGVLVSNGRTQAVTEAKLEELTREVREHNNFARRIPVLEEKVSRTEARVRELETLHGRQ